MKYYFNENVTVAVYETAWEDAINYFSAMLNKSCGLIGRENGWFDFRELIYPHIKKYIRNSYRGKAKCAPGDNFDRKTGKDIARARALEKYYRDMQKFSIALSKSITAMKNCHVQKHHRLFEAEMNQRAVYAKEVKLDSSPL